LEEAALQAAGDVVLGLILGASLLTYDVLISAGHEGRPQSCAHFPQHRCNLGATGERSWTPVVADAATQVLRRYGVTVARRAADFTGSYSVGAAVFIHFDGSDPPCRSSASIGYPNERSAAAAAEWRKLYGSYWPFGFEPDNFTTGLREYYAYGQVVARDGSLVLELGEITCPHQRAWLAPRLHWLGALVAYFLSRQINKGNVPKPRMP
jgi:hypothetical protein